MIPEQYRDEWELHRINKKWSRQLNCVDIVKPEHRKVLMEKKKVNKNASSELRKKVF